MAAQYTALVTAKLVGGSLQKAIESESKNAKISLSNIQIDASKLVKEIQDAINKTNFKINVTGLGQQIGRQLGTGITKQVQSSLKNIGIQNGGIKTMERMLQCAGFNKAAIAEVTKEFDRMSVTVTKIKTTMLKNGNIKMNIVGVDEMNRAVTIAREFEKETGRVVNTSKSYTQNFTQATKAIDQQAEAQKKLKKELKEAAEARKKEQAEIKETAKQQLNLTRANTLSNNIQSWMNNNTTAAKHFKEELERIKSDLSKPDFNGKSLSQLSAEFQNIKARANSAGMVMRTFATNVKNVGLMALGITSTYAAVTKAIGAIRTGANTVIELDTALVDLRKTTTMSGSDLEKFYSDANVAAKQLGVTTKDIIQSAADWSRLGYSDKRSATNMAKMAAQMAAISPGMTIESATTGLVSIMKAYKIDADDVLDGIMSKINRVGNTAATSNNQIINGLQNSASALAAMNTDLDKSIALFTAGQEIAQDDTKVGNALRSISLRIRGYDEETEELSEDLVRIKGDVIDLTKVASNNYKGVSLFTDETQTQYKDVYDYLEGISEIWDELSAKTRQTLMEKLFGKNRANIGLAIIQNFDAARKAMDEMSHSAGDADREMSIITESLDFKFNALKQTGTGIWQNLFPREDIGKALDGATKVLEVVEKMTASLGPGGTLAAAVGAGGIGLLIKNIGWLYESTLQSEILKLAYDGQEHAIMAA